MSYHGPLHGGRRRRRNKGLFINDTHIPVITWGNPTDGVEVAVIPVGG